MTQATVTGYKSGSPALPSSGPVTAVLRESGPGVPNDRSIYNIAILDYLLEYRSQDADTVIRRLAAWRPDEREFVQAYEAVDPGTY